MKNATTAREPISLGAKILVAIVTVLAMVVIGWVPYTSMGTQASTFADELILAVGESGEIDATTARMVEEFAARRGWKPNVSWSYDEPLTPGAKITLEVDGHGSLMLFNGAVEYPGVEISKTCSAWDWVAG